MILGYCSLACLLVVDIQVGWDSFTSWCSEAQFQFTFIQQSSNPTIWVKWALVDSLGITVMRLFKLSWWDLVSD